jgi:WD40 repeat protein
MELSENFWPEDLELAVLAVHDIARSPQNSLLLLVVLDSDFDTPLWDFLSQILQPGILAQNRPSRLAVTPDGCHVVSGSSSGMLRVSDFATGKSKLILRATVPR